MNKPTKCISLCLLPFLLLVFSTLLTTANTPSPGIYYVSTE